MAAKTRCAASVRWQRQAQLKRGGHMQRAARLMSLGAALLASSCMHGKAADEPGSKPKYREHESVQAAPPAAPAPTRAQPENLLNEYGAGPWAAPGRKRVVAAGDERPVRCCGTTARSAVRSPSARIFRRRCRECASCFSTQVRRTSTTARSVATSCTARIPPSAGSTRSKRRAAKEEPLLREALRIELPDDYGRSIVISGDSQISL